MIVAITPLQSITMSLLTPFHSVLHNSDTRGGRALAKSPFHMLYVIIYIFVNEKLFAQIKGINKTLLQGTVKPIEIPSDNLKANI